MEDVKRSLTDGTFDAQRIVALVNDAHEKRALLGTVKTYAELVDEGLASSDKFAILPMRIATSLEFVLPGGLVLEPVAGDGTTGALPLYVKVVGLGPGSGSYFKRIKDACATGGRPNLARELNARFQLAEVQYRLYRAALESPHPCDYSKVWVQLSNDIILDSNMLHEHGYDTKIMKSKEGQRYLDGEWVGGRSYLWVGFLAESWNPAVTPGAESSSSSSAMQQ